MLYKLEVHDFIKKNFFELSQIMFIDYPNIILNYSELYLALINKKDLQEIFLKELFEFNQMIILKKDDIEKYEKQIIENLENKFNKFNKKVNIKVKTNISKNEEENERQQDIEYLAKIDFNF